MDDFLIWWGSYDPINSTKTVRADFESCFSAGAKAGIGSTPQHMKLLQLERQNKALVQIIRETADNQREAEFSYDAVATEEALSRALDL